MYVFNNCNQLRISYHKLIIWTHLGRSFCYREKKTLSLRFLLQWLHIVHQLCESLNNHWRNYWSNGRMMHTMGMPCPSRRIATQKWKKKSAERLLFSKALRFNLPLFKHNPFRYTWINQKCIKWFSSPSKTWKKKTNRWNSIVEFEWLESKKFRFIATTQFE